MHEKLSTVAKYFDSKMNRTNIHSRFIMLHMTPITQRKRSTLPTATINLFITCTEFVLGGYLGRVEIDFVVDFAGGFVEAGCGVVMMEGKREGGNRGRVSECLAERHGIYIIRCFTGEARFGGKQRMPVEKLQTRACQ